MWVWGGVHEHSSEQHTHTCTLSLTHTLEHAHSPTHSLSVSTPTPPATSPHTQPPPPPPTNTNPYKPTLPCAHSNRSLNSLNMMDCSFIAKSFSTSSTSLMKSPGCRGVPGGGSMYCVGGGMCVVIDVCVGCVCVIYVVCVCGGRECCAT